MLLTRIAQPFSEDILEWRFGDVQRDIQTRALVRVGGMGLRRSGPVGAGRWHNVRLGFFQRRFHKIHDFGHQGDRDFVFTQDKVIAIVEPNRLVSGDALLGIVEKGAVYAEIGEEIGALPIMHGAMVFGQNALRVLQYPVILRCAADTDRSAV